MPPGNLPIQPTSFVGRRRELAEVERCLSTSHLLTLTGTGGVGKTRLALQAAERARGQFGDGVWLVDLAPVTDARLVPQAVAAALDVREQDGESLTQTLVATLQPRSLLLVIDNCERLVEGCAALVDALLRTCPGLRVLATSREALSTGGEVTWIVTPLSLPKPGRAATPDEALKFESVCLFVDRARAGVPQFALSDQNVKAVVSVCEHLDGIPLAIELAAARLRALTVEEIGERLQDRFRLLTTGARTATARHQTLRALVDWSHDLLSEPERVLFRRLSGFAGGWTIAAAESVCGDAANEQQVLELLAQLVEKSLVVADPEAGETRYRLTETLRAYGAEKLHDAGEEAAVRSRHLDWALALAKEAEAGFRGREQAVWFQRVETELDNVRAALRWSTGVPGRLIDGLELSGTLWQFWWLRGHAPEGQRWLSELLTLTQPEAGLEEFSRSLRRARARAMTAVGFLCHKQQRTAEARPVLLEALATWRDLGDKRLLALTLRELGHTALEENDDEEARLILEEGLALAEESGSRQQRQDVLFPLGLIAQRAGDWERARALLEECVVLGREEGDLRRVALPSLHLGGLLLDRGLLAEARSRLLESMTAHNEAGIRAGVAPALVLLACLEATEGRPPRALRLAGAAAAIAGSLGATEAAYVHAQAQAEAGLESARMVLGAKAAAAAWSEGEAMTVGDAIAYAIDGGQADSRRAPTQDGAHSPLSAREEEVTALVAGGMTNRQIATALFISEWTAKRHLENILHRLGLDSRAQVAAWASTRSAVTGTPATLRRTGD